MRLFTKFFTKGGGTSMLTCNDVCLLGCVFIVGLLIFLFCLLYGFFKISREGNLYT